MMVLVDDVLDALNFPILSALTYVNSIAASEIRECRGFFLLHKSTATIIPTITNKIIATGIAISKVKLPFDPVICFLKNVSIFHLKFIYVVAFPVVVVAFPVVAVACLVVVVACPVVDICPTLLVDDTLLL